MYPSYYYTPMRNYGQHHPQHHGGGGNSPVLPFLAGLAGGGLLFSAFSGATPYGPSPYGPPPYGPGPYSPSPYGPTPYGVGQYGSYY